MAQAGVSYTIGRESNSQYGETYNGIRPPASYDQLPSGVDPYIVPGDPSSGLLPGINASPGGPLGSADSKLQAYEYRLCLTNVPSNTVPITQPPGYNPANYELLFRSIAAGQTSFWGAFAEPNGKIDANNAAGVSFDFVQMNNSFIEADYATRAQIALAHENYQRGLIWAVQNDPRVPAAIQSSLSQWGLPADEFADTNHWPPQLYVREGRRMISDYVMTESNWNGSTVAPDSIGLAGYQCDSHNVQRYAASNQVWTEGDIQIPVTATYPVAYASIVPKNGQCANLLVPWCVSASHSGFSSLRTEPEGFILGQAAGTAACIAIDDATSVQSVSYPKLSAQLIAEGQVIAPPAPASATTLTGPTVYVSGSTGVAQTGTWYHSTGAADYYGAYYLHDGDWGEGSKSVSFTPTVVTSGTYTVYMWWTEFANRATNVPVDILSASGASTVIVNEQQPGGMWVPLGNYPFNSGTSGSVLVRNTAANGYVIADAVLLGPPIYPAVSVLDSNGQATAISPVTGAARPGAFTFVRTGAIVVPLTVNISVGGTAISGVDYSPLPASVTIPAGSPSVTLPVNPLPNYAAAGDVTVTVTAEPSSSYTLGSINGGTVVIHATPSTPIIIGSLNLTATAGQPFYYQVNTANNPGGLFSAIGLPPGLGIDSTAGIISGTATAPGVFNATINASNVMGAGSASLLLTVVDNYQAWQQRSFTASDLADPTISGDTAAPAGDGIPNLMKYALGLPPKNIGLAGLPVLSNTSLFGNTYATLTYTCPAQLNDISYIVEVSSDLLTWNTGNGYTLPLSVVTSPDGSTNTCAVEDVNPIGTTPQFMRLRISRP